LNAYFYTENNSVKEVLESSLQQLRDSLGRQDLRLNEAFVFVDDGRGDNSSLYYEGKNRSGAVLYGRYDYNADGDTPAEPLEVGGRETDYRQVNYLV
jgi:flagellar hook-length control protein FliK